MKAQTGKKYTVPYVVYEKTTRCANYPPDGIITFHNIIVECDGKDCTQDVKWEAKVKDANCNMQAHVEKGAFDTSSNEISITWDTSLPSKYDNFTDAELVRLNAHGWAAHFADSLDQDVQV